MQIMLILHSCNATMGKAHCNDYKQSNNFRLREEHAVCDMRL